MEYQTINIDRYKNYSVLRLNRPEVRNAMNGLMLDELIYFLNKAHDEKSCKLLFVRGEGDVFSAGADLNWMASAINASHKENVEESKKLYKVFKLFSTLPMVTVAWLHGAAIGGALGIAAGADFVWIDPKVKILFSEVKLGLVPATVAPFVLKRIGEIKSRQWMLTARLIDKQELVQAGFADDIVSIEHLSEKLNDLVEVVENNELGSMQVTKQLLHDLSVGVNGEEEVFTAKVIAEARAGDAAQKRIRQFLETKKTTS
jgi:methylglutaconyl-CoA hydratase